MLGRSSRSAGATYLDRARRIQDLKAAAVRAASRMPSIRRVYLFGSLIHGIPTTRSDADLLVEVTDRSHRNPRDRIPEVLAAMSPLPCPIDLFVATSSEIESAGHASPVVRLATTEGVDLLGNDPG